MKPGDLVEWIEDYRPSPDKLPEGYKEPAWDMSLVMKENGIVQAITRTFWGRWVVLIQSYGKMIEKDINDLTVIS